MEQWGNWGKIKETLKRFLQIINLDVVLIQETKRDSFDRAFIKSIWSSKDICWAFVEAVGRFGGILTLWGEGKISLLDITKGEFSFTIKCCTICKKHCWISDVYGPIDSRERRRLWAELMSIVDSCNEPWNIGGDFNSIDKEVKDSQWEELQGT